MHKASVDGAGTGPVRQPQSSKYLAYFQLPNPCCLDSMQVLWGFMIRTAKWMALVVIGSMVAELSACKQPTSSNRDSRSLPSRWTCAHFKRTAVDSLVCNFRPRCNIRALRQRLRGGEDHPEQVSATEEPGDWRHIPDFLPSTMKQVTPFEAPSTAPLNPV